MSKLVRVRFAPSPTGHLHIGNARAAILNWIFSRHAGGRYILRVEDTDIERSSAESEQSIQQDLRWLGLEWDEGPEVGGDYGPYRQSERLSLYNKYAQKLLDKGLAFHCFCTQDELESERRKAIAEKRQPVYSGRCRKLSKHEREAFERQGRKPVLRLLFPNHAFTFRDLVKGEVTFPAGDLGDFVIARADGVPTYNFAVVIDDALMQISHVIRGDDHVANTPKQLAVYEALKWPPPQFAHIPMILGEDRTRLSKRHGATSVDQYAQKGFLPHALVNYLSLLSWSSESGDDILSLDRLISEFDFNRVSRSPAVFDPVKLTWMNGIYIRQTEVARLTDLSVPYLQKAGFNLPANRELLEKIIASVQDMLELLEDVVEKARMFFVDSLEPESEEAAALLSRESTQKVFWSFVRQSELYDSMTSDNFRKMMKVVGKETGVMGKDLWMPIRVALTGQLHGPELPKVAENFGKEKCVAQIRKWIVG
ncbi:MAG: glutamate--tRNA ligase [bacterium]